MKSINLCVILVVGIIGCASNPVAHAIAPKTSHATPAALIATAHGLDALILLSVVVIGVAVGVYFLALTGHELSFSLGAGSATVFLVSIVARVTLWLIPWIAVGLGAAALIALGWEFYSNYKTTKSISAAVSATVHAVASDVATVAGMAHLP